MKVVILNPCEPAREKEIVGSDEEIEHIIDGYIDTMTLDIFPNISFVFNPDAESVGYDKNFENFDTEVFGTAVFLKIVDDEFESLSSDEAEELLEYFNSEDVRF